MVPDVHDGAWQVRDTAGGVLPLSRRFPKGWHLLALSGGGPLTLAGEFDGDALEPLSCLVAGRFLTLTSAALEGNGRTRFNEEDTSAQNRPPLDHPPELAEVWKEATTSALVGVERRPVKAPTYDDPLARVVRGLETAEPSKRLLGLAAAATLYGRAGHKPAIDTAPLSPPCESDEQPPCASAPTARLRHILDGTHADLLTEWIELLAGSKCRLPEDVLPELLDLGRQQSRLRPLLRTVLGRRGRWLAARNADWSYVGGEADLLQPETVWQTGTRPERLAALRALREGDPARGRELLVSTWATEPANDRAAFLEAFEIGLSMADEPFLESALDDRAKTVRKAAADLLPRLPESRLSLRMAERPRACVRWVKGLIHSHLEVEPPTECDPAMVRDGIEPKPPQGTGQRGWWLRQVVAATPLTSWSGVITAPPSQVLKVAMKTDWGCGSLDRLVGGRGPGTPVRLGHRAAGTSSARRCSGLGAAVRSSWPCSRPSSVMPSFSPPWATRPILVAGRVRFMNS